MKASAIAAACLLALAAVSCSQKKWTVSGTIEGGAGKELILEAANESGRWYGVDTTTIADNGSFTFSGEPTGHPEVYRVRLGQESAYFPIDSLESVTLSGKAASLSQGYKLAGSPEAESMQRVNELVDSAVAVGGEGSIAGDDQLRRRLSEVVLRNPSGVTAYYTIFRRVGNTPVFDASRSFDNRIIGAVANAFNEQRPADPRTKMLTTLFLQYRTRNYAPADTLVAKQIQYPDIALSDLAGKTRRLSDINGRGKVVVLNFTAYSAQESPAINVALAKVYDAHKAQGLEIYQVGFDPDEYLWRQSAKNIPWIAVYHPSSASAEVLMNYNVGQLPATFIFSRDGDLQERVSDLTKLEGAVQKYL